jgi:hypothetical protein
MGPFVADLTSLHGEPLCIAFDAGPNFGRIKTVISLSSFFCDSIQIGSDPFHRIGSIPEPDELRMMFVSFRLPCKDLLCKQCLSPQSDQAFAIEVFWVNRPEAHRFLLALIEPV